MGFRRPSAFAFASAVNVAKGNALGSNQVREGVRRFFGHQRGRRARSPVMGGQGDDELAGGGLLTGALPFTRRRHWTARMSYFPGVRAHLEVLRLPAMRCGGRISFSMRAACTRLSSSHSRGLTWVGLVHRGRWAVRLRRFRGGGSPGGAR
jgi:hypothetical protein